jgi:hypothetical protein
MRLLSDDALSSSPGRARDFSACHSIHSGSGAFLVACPLAKERLIDQS